MRTMPTSISLSGHALVNGVFEIWRSPGTIGWWLTGSREVGIGGSRARECEPYYSAWERKAIENGHQDEEVFVVSRRYSSTLLWRKETIHTSSQETNIPYYIISFHLRSLQSAPPIQCRDPCIALLFDKVQVVSNSHQGLILAIFF